MCDLEKKQEPGNLFGRGTGGLRKDRSRNQTGNRTAAPVKLLLLCGTKKKEERKGQSGQQMRFRERMCPEFLNANRYFEGARSRSHDHILSTMNCRHAHSKAKRVVDTGIVRFCFLQVHA